MSMAVAVGLKHRHLAIRVNTEKAMRFRDGLQCVNGHIQTAVSAIFDAYR